MKKMAALIVVLMLAVGSVGIAEHSGETPAANRY